MPISREALDSLNVDLAKEHAAVYQYEAHAAQLRDTAISRLVREMAREEMWHMEWLIEAISERGGEPAVGREAVYLSEGLVTSLEKDVEAEIGALEHYDATLALVRQDEELVRLLERVMDDERHHRSVFEQLAGEVGAGAEQAFAARLRISPTEAQAAAPVIELEYEGLLQYLWNKYGCGDCEQAETYFELAINEMRHMGWIADDSAGVGVPRAAEGVTGRVTRVRTKVGAHDRAEGYEQHAREVLSSAEEGVADDRLRDDLRRVAFQHDYHRFQLEHMEEG